MLRGFRHTLFLLLQVGVIVSGAIAWALWPDAWAAILFCIAGTMLASIICERIASHYLRSTVGQLRRAADDVCRGRTTVIDANLGGDFYKLVNAINLLANRLAEAGREEQRLQDELRRRERLAFLGELAATVAHDVNNPLDGVQNCVRILRRSKDDPQRADQMFDLIEGGLVRIEIIVRRLLTLASDHGIRPVRVPVRDVVASAIAAVEQKIESHGIAIVRTPITADDTASVDPQLLEQVFVNLMLNAADSMTDGGTLTITIGLDAGDTAARASVLIDIADTGTGIDPEVLPHIFEPFYTTKSGGRGTGLGLAIAARIIDAHHGRIEVESREAGGTVFHVHLPADIAPTQAVQPHASASQLSA